MKSGFRHKLDGRTLYFSKRGKDGDWGQRILLTPGKSKTGKESDLSYFITDPHFNRIRKAVEHELARLTLGEREHSRPRRDAILRGLRWAGEFLGFTVPDFKDDHMLWLCPDHEALEPFVEWRVLRMPDKDRPFKDARRVAEYVRQHHKRFAKLERESEALMRDTYVVFKNTCMLVPARLRKDEHHHDSDS
jgi:hypothetical protein